MIDQKHEKWLKYSRSFVKKIKVPFHLDVVYITSFNVFAFHFDFASATISILQRQIVCDRVKMADLQEKLVPDSFPSKDLATQQAKITLSERKTWRCFVQRRRPFTKLLVSTKKKV